MSAGESNAIPSWKRPWTIKEINDAAKCWSLAADAGICELIKSLSTDLLTEIAQISNNINELSIESRQTDVLIQNAFNDFCMLANDQFMENLVEEVSSSSLNNTGAKDALETGSQSKEAKMAQIVPQVTESIRLGLLVLDNQFEMLEVQKTTPGSFSLGQNDDVDGVDHSVGVDSAVYDGGTAGHATGCSEAIYQPRDPYEHRHLPHLIGTIDFVEDDTLGIGYLDDLDELKSVSIDDEDEDGDDEGRKRLQIGGGLSSSSDEDDPLSESESDVNKPVSMATRPDAFQAMKRRSSSESIDLFATDTRRDSDLDDIFDTGVVPTASVSIGNVTETTTRPLTAQEAMHRQLQEKLGLTTKNNAGSPVASPREVRPPTTVTNARPPADGAGPDGPLASSGECPRPTASDKVYTTSTVPKAYSLFDDDEDDSSDNLFQEPSSPKRNTSRPAGAPGTVSNTAPVAPGIGAAVSSSISEGTRQPLATRGPALLVSTDDDDDLFSNAPVSTTTALARSMPPGTASTATTTTTTTTAATLAVPAIASTAASSPRAAAAGAARKQPVTKFLDTDSDEDDDIFKPKPVSRKSHKTSGDGHAAAPTAAVPGKGPDVQAGTREARAAREPASGAAKGGKYPFSESDSDDDIFEPIKGRPPLKPAVQKPAPERASQSPNVTDSAAPLQAKLAASPMPTRPESPATRAAQQGAANTMGRPLPTAARTALSSDSDDSIFGDYGKPVPPKMPSMTKSIISKSEPDATKETSGDNGIHGHEAAPAHHIPSVKSGKPPALHEDSDSSDDFFSPTARPVAPTTMKPVDKKEDDNGSPATVAPLSPVQAAAPTTTTTAATAAAAADATDPLSVGRPSTRKLPPGARNLFGSSATTGASITEELVRNQQRRSQSQAAQEQEQEQEQEEGDSRRDAVHQQQQQQELDRAPHPGGRLHEAVTLPAPAVSTPSLAPMATTTKPAPIVTTTKPAPMATVSAAQSATEHAPIATEPAAMATVSAAMPQQKHGAAAAGAGGASSKISALQSKLALHPGGIPIIKPGGGGPPPSRQTRAAGNSEQAGRDEPDDGGGREGGEGAVSLDSPAHEVKQLVLLTKGRARNMPRRRPPTTGAGAAAAAAPTVHSSSTSRSSAPAPAAAAPCQSAGDGDAVSTQVDTAAVVMAAQSPSPPVPPPAPQHDECPPAGAGQDAVTPGHSAAPPAGADPLLTGAATDGHTQQPAEGVTRPPSERLDSSDIFAGLPSRPDKRPKTSRAPSAAVAAASKKQGAAKVPVNVSEIDDIFAVDTRPKKKAKAKLTGNDPLGAN